MNAIRDRPIKVNFRADVNSKMKWNFRPVQSSVTVRRIFETLSLLLVVVIYKQFNVLLCSTSYLCYKYMYLHYLFQWKTIYSLFFSVSPRRRAHVLVHHFKGKRYENGHACHAQYWIYSSVVDLYGVVDLEVSSWVTLPSLCCCQGSVNVEKYGKGVVSTLHSGDDFGKLAIVNDVAR